MALGRSPTRAGQDYKRNFCHHHPDSNLDLLANQPQVHAQVAATKMDSTNTPIPIILCGAKVALGQESANFMKPELEVVHFCASVDAACAEIPRLLSDEAPQPAEGNDVGTHNYSARPQAVLFGRTYTDDKLQAVLEACEGKGEVSWVIPGEAAGKNEVPGPGHATKVATNMKNVLVDLINTGRMGTAGEFKYAF